MRICMLPGFICAALLAAAPAAGQPFTDDFDRASLGPDWVVDAGSFAIVGNELIENSGVKFLDAQMRYVGGQTLGVDQFSKLQIRSQASHTFGFMFRVGDPSGLHYEVHLSEGTSEWRWELYDPAFVAREGDCAGDQPASTGDWVGARIDGVGNDTVVSVWRWASDPGDDTTAWGPADCQMSGDPSQAVDAGTGLGIRSYTGNSSQSASADDWSGGDGVGPVEPPAPDPGGTIIRILGEDGAGVPNSVRDPDGITIDSIGNVYVGACGAGPQSMGVFKIAPDLTVTQVLDWTGDGTNMADCIVGLDVDSQDNVYAAAFFSNNVFRITPGGTITQVMDSTGAGVPDSLEAPIDVALDSNDNLFVAAFFSDRVFKRTPGGTITQVLTPDGDLAGTPLVAPFGMAVDASDNLIVPGFGMGSDAVFRVTPGGSVSVILDASGDGQGNTLDAPHSVAVGPFGNIFVTGNFSDNVFKVTPGGSKSVILDASGDGLGNGMDNPTGIATDAVGNVYVNAFDSSNAFEVTPAGRITEIIDFSGDGSNFFDNPADVGICVGEQGTIYTAGTASDNVFKVILPPPPVPVVPALGLPALALLAALLGATGARGLGRH